MNSAKKTCRHILASIRSCVWISSCILVAHVLSAQPAATHGVLFTSGVSYTSADGEGSPKFPVVDLVFNLRNADGAPIVVHPDALALFSQGQQVGTCTGIRTFDRTGYGTSTVIALDASGALRALTPNAVNLAVFTVVHDGVKQDTTAVTTLAEDFQVDLPFHPGARKWKANTALFPERGTVTHLYDGLLQATSLFTPGLPRRRILLVIADGRDQGSQHTPLDLLARAKSLGIEIDVIALSTSAPSSQQNNELTILQQISLATGGVYFLAHSGDEVQQMIALHLSAVRASPVAEFQLTHLSPDGKVTALQLRWLAGNQTTPAFITPPNTNSSLPFHLAKFANPLLTNPWLLSFSGCFLLGVALLIVSFFLPRSPRQAERQVLSDGFFRAPGVPTASPAPRSMPDILSDNYKRIELPRYSGLESERPKTELATRFAAPPQGPYARIIIRNHALAGKIFPMTITSFSIGALPGNDLVLPGDSTISGNHLRLLWENATLYLEDNHSTNGTWLNRLRVSAGRHILKPGDEIGLGQTFLIVEQS